MAEKYTDHAVFDRKPQKVPTSVALRQFLHNPADGSYFGRTPKSWMQITFFYVVFYTVLGALFSISMWVFLQTVDPRIPKWKLDSSLIGTNPGLGFRPMPPDHNVESSLIWYRGTARDDYKYWVDNLESFLKVYRTPGMLPGRGQNLVTCSYDTPTPKGKVCEVDIRSWDPCTEQNNYNYHKSGPCVFLKLNKIFGWVPEFYNSSQGLPAEMPLQLKDHIQNMERTGARNKLNTVWISCEGENPADVENLGAIKYIPPEQGFPGYYFPYENSEGYLSPLVAIVFERPRNGILINIQCKAWARNIIHNAYEKLGLVHMELMID